MTLLAGPHPPGLHRVRSASTGQAPVRHIRSRCRAGRQLAESRRTVLTGDAGMIGACSRALQVLS
jgi:hypothetical protein